MISIYRTKDLNLVKAFHVGASIIQALKVNNRELWIYSRSRYSSLIDVQVWDWENVELLRSSRAKELPLSPPPALLNYSLTLSKNTLRIQDDSIKDKKKTIAIHFPNFSLSSSAVFTFADRRVFILQTAGDPLSNDFSSQLVYLKPVTLKTLKNCLNKLNRFQQAHLAHSIFLKIFKANALFALNISKSLIQVIITAICTFFYLLMAIICSDIVGTTELLIRHPEFCLGVLALISLGMGIGTQIADIEKWWKQPNDLFSSSLISRLAIFLDRMKNQRILALQQFYKKERDLAYAPSQPGFSSPFGVCPLSGQAIHCPAKLENRYYERAFLLECLAFSLLSPKTGQPVNVDEVDFL